ncbi:hypothetical protein ASPZODRAFT_168063 [Penicilliopsis zonata CBS 506.65]|uniref:DNA polymerase delta subunit 4 n=1 Tax=Penicilliopsis zonata CBS 506.65 TaxID=1073090 RepID=A0A1L9SCK0_9EURO|nr:hypothetical protein ASPZODRAFT_168063 [Penicilliopsis zonata CBS 506.65]OJJ44945.1 hypothetical protein ASPZODRAFT_168063 [Penicilliopsis zonata CBS 506.65]
MPPSRRGGNASTRRPNQSTLSFGTRSRITKPTATPTQSLKAKNPVERAVVPDVVTPEPAQPHIAEVVVREQAKEEVSQPLSAEDERALKVSQRDLQRYWKGEEAKRRTPRVHQQDLSLEEKILRHFDLSSQYGPCIGIARLKRWRRASMLNLDPPIEVLAVLLKAETDVNQRAHVDELMS